MARSQGKTDCKEWHTDGWEGYSLVLLNEVEHYISRLTQREEANQWDSPAFQGVGIADKALFSKVWERPCGDCKARPELL